MLVSKRWNARYSSIASDHWRAFEQPSYLPFLVFPPLRWMNLAFPLLMSYELCKEKTHRYKNKIYWSTYKVLWATKKKVPLKSCVFYFKYFFIPSLSSVWLVASSSLQWLLCASLEGCFAKGWDCQDGGKTWEGLSSLSWPLMSST